MKIKKINNRTIGKIVILLFIALNFIACSEHTPSHTASTSKHNGMSKSDSSSSQDTDAAEALPLLLHH